MYDRRTKFTKNEQEERLMAQIDYRYMTEESESDGTIRRRELTWRSDGEFYFKILMSVLA